MRKSKFVTIKKSLLILLALAFPISVICQNYTGNPDIDFKDVRDFKATTLLVVVDSPQSAIGKALTTSFNKYWKFTKFKFITSAELDKNLNNPAESFFTFTMVGGYKKGNEFLVGTAGALIDIEGAKQLFILLGDTSIPGKVYYKNRNIAKTAKCSFAIFQGDKGIKKVDQGLYSGVDFIDYLTPTQPETGLYEKGMWHKETQFDLYHTLNADEQLTAPYIAFYIQRIEQHLEYVFEHKGGPKTKKDDYKISWQNLDDKSSDVAKMTYYDDGLQQIKNMTILIDSAITDDLGKKILSISLGISEASIQLVPWSKIEDAINTQAAGIAILYQKKLDFTADPGYVFWTTDGKRLIDWNFRHIGAAPMYGFGFRKDDANNCLRSDVHLIVPQKN